MNDRASSCCVLAALTLLVTTTAPAEVLDPSDARGLRSFDGGGVVILLDGMAVKCVTEDRTIIHFDVSAVDEHAMGTLVLPIQNWDPGPPPGILKVYTFAGDGEVSIDEWDSGELFHTWDDLYGLDQTLTLDVTSALQEVINGGGDFLSVNLQACPGTDRYWLGDSVQLPDPTLIVESPTPVRPVSWSHIKSEFR